MKMGGEHWRKDTDAESGMRTDKGVYKASVRTQAEVVARDKSDR
jgi:hypothetical protein